MSSAEPTNPHPTNRWGLSKGTIGELQILACGVFFGLTFVGERKAMIDGMNAYTFNFARYFVSIFALIIFQPLFYMLFESKSDVARELEEKRLQEHNGDENAVRWAYRRDVVVWGGLISLVCFGGATLQQIGMENLSASKTGFITRLQVIVVPLIEWVIPGLGGHMDRWLFSAICISTVGLYLLSGCTESACFEGHLEPGEIWVVASMLCWALCTVFSVFGCRYIDSMTITYVHFIAVTVLCLVVAVAADPSSFKYPFDQFVDNWVMILAVGVFECLGFVLSGLAYMYVECSRASLLLTSITVFTAIFGYLFLDETLTGVETTGAILVMLAVLFIYREPLIDAFISCFPMLQSVHSSTERGFEMLPVDSVHQTTTSPMFDDSNHPCTDKCNHIDSTSTGSKKNQMLIL